MSHITSPVNSMGSQDIPKRTELYDPEDPSLDDDVVPIGVETKKEVVDYYSPGDNSSDDNFELSSSSKANKGSHHMQLESTRQGKELSCSSNTSSVATEHYLGHPMRFLVDLGKEPETNQRFKPIDMFSCDDSLTTAVEVEHQKEGSQAIRAFDSRLSSLLDSGLLNIHLNAAPMMWKERRDKSEQVLPSGMRGVSSAEDDDLVVEDQMGSLLGGSSQFIVNQVKRSESVTSPPPQFLKPRDDDECEPLYSPPRVIKLNREVNESEVPRPIRLSRERSPAEPVQDDELVNNCDSALEPPRIIRLDRDEGTGSFPPVIKLNRENNTKDLSDSCNIIEHDTPAEPLRIIRLNRFDSPKEAPRIIQLDRSLKLTSDSSSHKGERGNSRERSPRKSSANLDDNYHVGSNRDKKVLSKDRDEQSYSSSKSERKRSRSTSRERNRDKYSSVDKHKSDGKKEYRSYDEPSRKTDDRSHDKSGRKRDRSKERMLNGNFESAKRHKDKDRFTPEPDSVKHKSRRHKHEHSEEKRTPESSRERHKSADKSNRQSEDEVRKTKRYSDDKHSQSRRHNSEEEQSSNKKHSRQKSADHSSDTHHSKTKKVSDIEEEIGKAKSDYDLMKHVSSTSKKKRRSKHRTPDPEREHRRSSRSRSHKHKSKSRRHKHKRSCSGSRKRMKSRSVSKTVLQSNSRSLSPDRKKHKVKRKLQEHVDRDHTGHRHRSRSCSPLKHSELHDKSIEEKEKSILAHVGYSSHSILLDDDRKHSFKQTPFKDQDTERSLSLLEVCMKTKYGPDFDASALRAKHLVKSSADDDDIEIVGVTYGSDDVLHCAGRLSPRNVPPEDRKKDGRLPGSVHSTCYTIEDEPLSHDLIQMQSSTSEVARLEPGLLSDDGEHLRNGKTSDQCNELVEDDKFVAETRYDCHQTELPVPLDNIRQHPIEISSKEETFQMHNAAESVTRNHYTDSISPPTVDSTSRSQLANKSSSETDGSFLGTIPSEFDHIPGICDDTFVADDACSKLSSDSFAQLITGDNKLSSELHPISSPEPESAPGEILSELNCADIVAGGAAIVPLERVETPRRTSRTASSSSDTCGSEPTSTVKLILPYSSDTYGTPLNTDCIDVASENTAKPCPEKVESSIVFTHYRPIVTNASVSSHISLMRTADAKRGDILSSELQTDRLSPGPSAASYSTGVMSSSRLDSCHRVTDELITTNGLDPAGGVEVSVPAGISNALPVHRAVATHILPSLLVSSDIAVQESGKQSSLSVSISDSNSGNKVPAPLQNLTHAFPAITNTVTSPIVQFAKYVTSTSQPAPQLGQGLSTNQNTGVAIQSSIQPILRPSSIPSSLTPDLRLSLPNSSTARLQGIQAQVTGSSTAPTLPVFVETLFTGSSNILPGKTVEELQQLTQLFNAPVALTSTVSTTFPVSSTAPKSTVVLAPVPPPVSEPTMAARLLASLISLSNSSSSASSVPAATETRKSAIDINVDDVASPKSDEMISFSPPPPAHGAIVDTQLKPKSVKKADPKSAPLSTSKSTKITESAKKGEGVTKIASEFKLILKPYYSSGKISKEEYKEIMRKAVPQIYQSRSGDTSKSRMTRYAEQYVNKVLLMRKYLAKKKTQNSGAS